MCLFGLSGFKTKGDDRKEDVVADKHTSYILKGIKIKGEISGEGNILIEGEVEGEITNVGSCSIESQGLVTGNISSESLIVAGHIVGNISATDRLEIQATGQVEGDIKVPRISIADGAKVNGTICVGQNAKK